MPLAIYTSAAWTANGGLSPASQALVTVRSESTGGLASLFEDRDGNSGLDNPFNADSQGRFEFYVTGGAYRVEVESDGFTQELRHQAVGTAAEFDAGALSDHESPEDKELLARLDHLESALGVDTEGPAGADVLAAVGRGAIVESDTNANGNYVRWENGEQKTRQRVTVEVESTAINDQSYSFPADFTQDPVRSITPADIRGSAIGTGNTQAVGLYGESSPSASGGRARLYSQGSEELVTGESVEFDVVAWGFWK